MRADRALKKISRDEEQWARALFREKAKMDYRSEMNAARRNGRAEGKAEGLAEGEAKGEAKAKREAEEKARQDKLEIARNLKIAGVPMETIAESLGFKIKEITKL